jgi:hypothetical protein
VTKKIDKLIGEMDPAVKSFVDYKIEGGDEKPSPDQPIDPVADTLFRDRWGFDRPVSDGGNPAPAQKTLSRSEIAEVLQDLSKTLNKPAFASTKPVITKALAAAARENLEPDNPMRLFLEGYAAGDKTAQRSAIESLVAKSRDEIIRYVKAGGNPVELLVRDEKDELSN